MSFTSLFKFSLELKYSNRIFSLIFHNPIMKKCRRQIRALSCNTGNIWWEEDPDLFHLDTHLKSRQMQPPSRVLNVMHVSGCSTLNIRFLGAIVVSAIVNGHV